MSERKVVPPQGKTDVIFQEIKLYIEGVQVPFININITSSIGTLPAAYITIPPLSGLMEISRFYSPKVHIFFIDPTDGVEKLLFNGIITGNGSNRSAGGSNSISFNCVHRNQLLAEMLMDFTDPTKQG